MKDNQQSKKAYELIDDILDARKKSDVKAMLVLSFEAIEIFKVLEDDYGCAKVNNLIGIAYFYNGMYEQAMDYLLEGLKLAEPLKNYKLICSIYNNMGEVFREAERYDTAIIHYQKGLEVCEQGNLHIHKASLLGNVGEVYIEKNQLALALEHSLRSHQLLECEENIILLAEAENRLGRIYFLEGRTEKAELFYKKALHRLKESDNKFYLIDVLINFAELYHISNTRLSFNYLEEARIYADDSRAKKKLSRIYELFADYYEDMFDFRMAHVYFKKYHYLDRELKTAVMGDTLEILGVETRIEELEKKVFTDSLTGIANRTYLDNHIEKHVKKAAAEKNPVLLLMIDIDHFKKYNDHWGHLQGDQCLVEVANAIQSIKLANQHELCRYGGEEFVYFGCVSDENQAKTIAEDIRKEIQEMDIRYNDDKDGEGLTITVGGVWGEPDVNTTTHELLYAADEALYTGKKRGRNKTVIKVRG